MWSIVDVFTLWVLIAETSSTEFDAPIYSDSPREYCQLETFSPRCWKDEIILIQHAIYGRMHTGRCLKGEDSKLIEAMGNDPKYLGCSADVLAILDRRCSGMNQCDIRLPDGELVNTKPCYEGLQMFLEAQYSCINVADDDRTCLFPATSTPQHILGYSSSSLGCGRKTQPWILEAPAGQRINITLVEFNGDVRKSANHRCDQYGFILEKSHKKNVSICSNLGRESNLYISISNSVEIVLTVNTDMETEEEDPTTRKFVLRFEASVNEAHSARAENSNYQVVGLLAICGVGLAICLMIICVGLICVRKIQTRYAKGCPSGHKTAQRRLPGDVEVPIYSRNTMSTTMKSQHPTYAVYGGSDGVNCSGSYNGTDPTQYFVLDPEVIAREQLIQ